MYHDNDDEKYDSQWTQLVKIVQSCLTLFKIVHKCSRMFKIVHKCSIDDDDDSI